MNRWIYFCSIMIIILYNCSSNTYINQTEIAFTPDVFPYVDTIYAEHCNQLPFYKLGQQPNKKLHLKIKR